MQVHEFQDGLRRRREELSGASLAEEAWSRRSSRLVWRGCWNVTGQVVVGRDGPIRAKFAYRFA